MPAAKKWLRFSDPIANYSQLRLIIFVLLISIIPTGTYAQNSSAPIVIELFTSKGCPACPKADRNFNALIAENPNIIGLSCHVTYFDRGARRDALSKSFCDARQNIYKLALKTGKIFTPMTVINGRAYTTGVKNSDIKALINKGQNRLYQPVGLLQNGEYLDISLPRLPLSEKADVWLLEIEKRPKQNAYTHYRNVVTNFTKLLRWDGKKINMAFPVGPPRANTGYAVFVQTYKGGITAAGKTGF